MDETSVENVQQKTSDKISEPETSDNSVKTDKQNAVKSTEDKSKDPSEGLILGKFKTVEDLTKAYDELQKHQGQCSAELGSLRHEVAEMNSLRENLDKISTLKGKLMPIIAQAKEKYNTPEYIQDPSFRELYGEALLALGENLDCDRFVNLVESYVSARIFAHERKSAANKETQQALNSLSHSENSKSSISKPKKRLDEMTEAEVDEMLDRLI